jgi:hypothetical protein
MNLERIEAIARNPARTRDELEQMKSNAFGKGDAVVAKLINDVILQRFPIVAKAGGGKTRTRATFRGRAEEFQSGKDAYLWLVERFHHAFPDALERYNSLHRSGGKGNVSSRFARTPAQLFPLGSKRAGDSKFYSPLSGEWFADTNINHDDKFAALLKLSYVCKVQYPLDWEFSPVGSTDALRKHQDAVIRAEEMLAELLGAG